MGVKFYNVEFLKTYAKELIMNKQRNSQKRDVLRIS